MEIFKDIKDFENYQISNYGNVYSKNRKRLIAPQLTNMGYMRVQLWNKQVQKKFLVHRLVADAFIDNPENKQTVNHKDSNRINNHVDNLEWNTIQENNKHGFEFGNHVGMNGDKNPYYNITGLNHPRSKKVINIKTNEIKSVREAAKEIGISAGYLSDMLKNNKPNKTNFKYYGEN